MLETNPGRLLCDCDVTERRRGKEERILELLVNSPRVIWLFAADKRSVYIFKLVFKFEDLNIPEVGTHDQTKHW